MTFINARILRKRPNLFVTPKRNYGNLLIKYESGQNSPADSGRQLASIHPEPTFTTSWTKSGLTVSADLSAITDAHNLFYMYLCRDDGTALATHQFAEGQTTISLQFTETNYGTFSYQLKLGTTVVASHTETYVRPKPTFTTSWTKSGITINANLSNIVGAHPEFYAYLCRDDGTTLATHQFQTDQAATSLAFTEADYGTFDYQLKLGTSVVSSHTATYTPPPIPTFNVALTNDDLAITATLTDIVNPDPYYTVSFYDSSSQIASHAFSTNDTDIVLNWNETTYGTKAYTIEINGALHSSHNIQLNEAVVFSDIEVLVSPQGNGDTATNITTNLSSGYTPNPPHDSAIKQRLSNNNTNTHDLANAVAWRNSDNNTDTKIIYEFPFITNVSKWKIWDARRDWTFTNYHVWFGDTEASLTKYAAYSFNPTTVWNNATPNSQTRTLSPVKETKYIAFSFDDISTNPSTGQGTAGPGVAEIKIWGYPSGTVSY